MGYGLRALQDLERLKVARSWRVGHVQDALLDRFRERMSLTLVARAPALLAGPDGGQLVAREGSVEVVRTALDEGPRLAACTWA